MLRLLAAFFLLVAAVVPADAAKRIALVIGNGKYEYVNPLANPPNDAALMADVLGAAGFEVLQFYDLDQRSMKQAMLEFGRKLKQGAEASVFYYAGHGVEVDGVNFLVPVDVDIKSKEETDIQNVRVNDFLALMENSGVPLNIVVFDACRNNPFRSLRATGGGLAPVRAPRGTYVAYATAAGEVAADGQGKNSPFTAALAESLAVPGLRLEDVFKRTREKVLAATGGEQLPFDSSAITGDFYFMPVEPPSVEPDALAADFELARALSTGKAWEEFLARHGKKNDFRVGVAKRELETLDPERKVAVLLVPPKVVEPEKTECATLLASVGGAETCLKPGDAFSDCVGCPEMVVVPAGSFTMGSPNTEDGHQSDEEPTRTVTIAKPFAVSRFEVTFDEWQACVDGGGCTGNPAPHEAGFGKGRHPVINVTWDDAQAYAVWLSDKTGQYYRLPSESEWEYSARAGTTTAYWTGKVISKRQANFRSSGTVEVDKYDANPFGLQGMHGNVWEWTQDCYVSGYADAPADGSAREDSNSCDRVVRGGGWSVDPESLRSAYRGRVIQGYSASYATGFGGFNLGFRLARTL